MKLSSIKNLQEGWDSLKSKLDDFENLSQEDKDFISNNSLQDAISILEKEGVSLDDLEVDDKVITDKMIDTINSLIKENPDGLDLDIGYGMPFNVKTEDLQRMVDKLKNKKND